jgi:concanavalin A-like lectin/glucanase superfamily protein/uncharacterized protein DUF2341
MSKRTNFNHFFKKLSKQRGLRTLLILGPLLPILFFLIRFTQPKEVGAWFNDNWLYRASIPVTNNTTEETAVYVTVSLDTSDTDKFQGDCGDLRFTKLNGQLLPYYITSGCGTGSTSINIYLDTLITGASTLYYYYGNPSVINGNSTTDFTTEASDYTIGGLGSEEQSPGPVAYWKFDEGTDNTCSGGINDACDATEHGNNLLFVGNTSWQSEDKCISGKCIFLDGTSDYVCDDYDGDGTCETNGDDDNPDTDILGDLTIMGWIKPTDDGRWRTLFGRDATSYGVRIDNSSPNVFKANINNASPISESMTEPEISNWYHVVYVVDDTNNMQYLYINGVLEDSDTQNNSPANSSLPFTIGARSTGGFDIEFKGFIDEVKIYPYARSASEIKNDAMLPGTIQGASASFGGPSTNYLNEGLVAYWKMDEGTGSTAADFSGIGNNGNLGTGDSAPTWSTGKFNSGLDFDGNDYVSAPYDSSLNISSATLAVWMNADSLHASKLISYKSAAGAIKYVIATQASGTIQAGFNPSGGSIYPTASDAYTADNWYHVVATYNNANGKGQLYINGILLDTRTSSGSNSVGNQPLYIGMDYNNTSYFDGTIDEVRIYNRALSSQEIQDLYNWAPGPIAHWKLDEGSGTNAYDNSGNNYTGTFGTGSSAPIWVSGKYSKAGKFDGIDDYINCSNNTALKSQNYTYSAWINIDSLPSNTNVGGVIFESYGSSEGSLFSVRHTGKLHIRPHDGGSASSTDSTSTLNTNEWYHVAGVLEGRNKYLYINGLLDNSAIMSSDYVPDSSAGISGIGGWGASYLNATIDDVRIYDYARTQAQIIEDMNGGIGGASSGQVLSSNSPLIHYKFDEGYGSTVYNSIAGTNNGTFGIGDSAPSWTNSGKFDKALDFETDGASDYVDLGVGSDGSALDLDDGDFTLSAWVNLESIGVDRCIICQCDVSQARWIELRYDHGDQMFEFDTNDGTSQYAKFNQISPPALSTWYHVVGVRDNTTIKIYVNGIEGATTDTVGTITDMDSDSWTIGRVGDSSSRYWDGLIDEVKIYNFALTQSQIKQDYNQGRTTTMGSLSTESDGSTPSNSSSRDYCIPGDTSTCNPPVGHWKMEEAVSGDAQTIYDSSGNGNNGTTVDGANNTGMNCAVSGKFGKGCDFDGTDDYVDAGADTILNFTDNFTINAWIKPYSFGDNNYGRIVDKQVNPDGAGYSFYLNNTPAGQPSGTMTLSSNVPNGGSGNNNIITLDMWQYVTMKYVESTNTVTFYVNGVNSGGYVAGLELSGSAATTLKIGDRNDFLRSFDGLIDDVRIYDYARTPAQIAWDYNKGQPIGWYKFDEGEGATTYDSMGNNNGSLGTGNSAPSWSTTGKRNGALDFDGTNDWVNIPYHSSNNIVNNIDYTISTWIYPEYTTQSEADIAIQNADGSATGRSHIWIDLQDSYCTGVDNQILSYLGNESTCTGVSADINTWYHVVEVVTENGSSDSVILYVNGVPKVTNTVNSETNTNSDWRIGRHRSIESANWEGQIDDVKIWNYALTKEQIKLEYNQGAINF